MRFRNKLAAVAAASAMALGVLAPAMAAINEGGSIDAPGFVGVKVYGGPGNINGWAGEMGSFGIGGYRVWCIEKGVEYPDSLSGARTITDNPLAAYVLSQYGDTTDDITAAATYYILGQDAGLQVGDSAGQRETFQRSENRAAIEALRQQILAEADQNMPTASGYDMAVSMTMASGNRTGTVNFSASGSKSGGINSPTVITLTGEAVFSDNGAKTMQVPANTPTASYPIQATGNGTVRVSAAATNQLPAPTFTSYDNGGQQDTVVGGGKVSVSASDPTAHDVVYQSNPTIETTSSAYTSAKKVGDTVVDTITVTDGTPGSEMTIQTRLYGPMATQPAQSPDAPAGTPLAWSGNVTVTLDANGNGTVSTPAYTIEEAGWYSYDTDFAETEENAAYDAGFGVNEETGNATKRKVTMATVASATGSHGGSETPDGSLGYAGDVVHDRIVVSGARPNSTIEVTSRLYYSGNTEPVQSPDAPASAELTETQTWTMTIDATGHGTKDITSKVMDRAGWYSWDTDFAGDKNHEKFDAGYGVPEETGKLALWSPKATTKTSDQLVTGVTELVDTVVVTNGKPGAEFSGSTTLYGPFATDPSVDGGVDLTDAPVVGTSTFTGAYDVDGKAEVTSEPQTTKGAGYYVWAETIDAVTLESNEFKQKKAMEAETSVEINPTITTTVNDQKVLPGHTITDKVEIGGIVNVVGGKKVTNVVTGTLYGPVAPVDGQCKAVDWTDAPVAKVLDATEVMADENGKAVLDEYGTYTLPDEEASLGCYTYEETLTSTVEGDETPVVVNHEKGQESQTTIALKPGLSTQVSEQMVKPGATLTDAIKVWDSADTKFTITAKLYGLADPGENRQCTTLTHKVWERMIAEGTAKLLGEETIVVDEGDGTYTTEGVTLPADATGCATWWEQADFEGSESSQIITEYGIVEETSTVINPIVTTLAHHEYDYAGSLFTDTIFVKGTHGNTGVITGKVLGPIAGKPDGNGAYTCDALDWTNAPVAGEIAPIEVNGDGTYTSTSVKTTTEGCYTFVETLTMDDGDVVVNTKPGEATETNYFADKPAEGEQGVDDTNVGSGDANAGAGGIEAGDPMVGSWNPWAVGAGITLLAGAGAVVAGPTIRRKRV